jgi:hypothetical protein
MKSPLMLIAPALLLAGCGNAGKSVEAELDADFAKGEVLLSCKAASSGTCHAIFLHEGDTISAQAEAGTTASVTGVGEGADYCVDAVVPEPNRCHPRPLVPGKQIVRRSTIRN